MDDPVSGMLTTEPGGHLAWSASNAPRPANRSADDAVHATTA
eukprot:gene15728-527_t